MQLPNVSELCITLLGCARARIIPVLLHVAYEEHDLDCVLNLTGARALVLRADVRGRDLLGLAPRMRDKTPTIAHVIAVGASDPRDAVGSRDVVDFDMLVEAGLAADRSRLELLRPSATDPFFVMFTSGTTGRPKAELHTHGSNQYWIKHFEQGQHFASDAHWIIVTPIAHLTGLGIGVLSALSRGAAFTLLTAWNAQRCVELLE